MAEWQLPEIAEQTHNFSQRPTRKLKAVWLRNPGGRIVQVEGEPVIDPDTGTVKIDPKTKEPVLVEGSAPEIGKALLGVGFWRLATQAEVETAKQKSERDIELAEMTIRNDIQRRAVRMGAALAQPTPAADKPAPTVDKKGGK